MYNNYGTIPKTDKLLFTFKKVPGDGGRRECQAWGSCDEVPVDKDEVQEFVGVFKDLPRLN